MQLQKQARKAVKPEPKPHVTIVKLSSFNPVMPHGIETVRVTIQGDHAAVVTQQRRSA